MFIIYPRRYIPLENYYYNSLKSQLYKRKTRILIHAKLPIFLNPRKFIHAKISTFTVVNESMVSSVSKRYMRVVIGTGRLLVCLSKYVTLGSVYTLLIAV